MIAPQRKLPSRWGARSVPRPGERENPSSRSWGDRTEEVSVPGALR